MTLPSQKARAQWLLLLAISILLVALLWLAGVELAGLPEQLPHLARLAQEMFPPRLSLFWENQGLLGSIADTFAMAFAGTILGFVFAFPAGLLSAANTTPHPAVRSAVRMLLSIERAITSFFFLLAFLVAFGLGPVAATLTLAIGTLGVFGKLFAESIERAEAEPVEAIQAVGATRLQQIFYGVLPQAAPALIANSLYAFDVNLRLAVALGLFGAGGLGLELNVANSTLRYRDVLAIALLILLLISTVERLSDRIRQNL